MTRNAPLAAPVRKLFAPLLLAGLAVTGVGCNRVERNLQVTSNPPGALVYLNGQEAGRTPMNKSFVWYGTYDVKVRKEGYKTVSAKEDVWAPWWQVPPLDLVADLLPFPTRDQHKLHYTLVAATEDPGDTQELVGRGERMRGQLTGSRCGGSGPAGPGRCASPASCTAGRPTSRASR
jgi:hypothetical protein